MGTKYQIESFKLSLVSRYRTQENKHSSKMARTKSLRSYDVVKRRSISPEHVISTPLTARTTQPHFKKYPQNRPSLQASSLNSPFQQYGSKNPPRTLRPSSCPHIQHCSRPSPVRPPLNSHPSTVLIILTNPTGQRGTANRWKS